MSSLPGYTLEEFLAWNWDLIVDGDGSANLSLQIAEALGVDTRRKHITLDRFNQLVALYEPSRVMVEDRLSDFDEDNQSWRDYAGYSFDFLDVYEDAAKTVLSGGTSL